MCRDLAPQIGEGRYSGQLVFGEESVKEAWDLQVLPVEEVAPVSRKTSPRKARSAC